MLLRMPDGGSGHLGGDSRLRISEVVCGAVDFGLLCAGGSCESRDGVLVKLLWCLGDGMVQLGATDSSMGVCCSDLAGSAVSVTCRISVRGWAEVG